MTAPGTTAEPAALRTAALDLRVLRAVPFATVCVLLAAGGHLLGSGSAIPWPAMLFGWLLALAAAIHGARRERGLRAITGGLAGGQLVLHLLFALAQAVRDAPTAPAMPGMPGMPGMSDGAPLSHAAFGITPGMLIGHLLATAAAGWWLRRGEAVLWHLAGSATRAAVEATRRCAAALDTVLALLTAGRATGTPGAVRTSAVARPPRRPGAVALRHVVVRRGPPVAAAR
ncbi:MULTISPECIES: hypothetical protein [Kitasatospora]|uniref:hypothetical protein n=1 Tax=Kitasatospora TaxID=2063 RepID=UPI000CB6F48A|nr:hypothetical protein [Kitasatospora sp. GP30]MDH6140305.1 plasmid stabilization system protein ParE [Kitasatospora sp. GP30]